MFSLDFKIYANLFYLLTIYKLYKTTYLSFTFIHINNIVNAFNFFDKEI